MDANLSGEDRLGQARLPELPHQHLDLGRRPPPLPARITRCGCHPARLPRQAAGRIPWGSAYAYRRMPVRIPAGRRRHVAEPPAAKVLEQDVAIAHGGHDQVRVPIVVEVGKGHGDGHPSCDPYAGKGRDILELSAAQVSPQLVAANLIPEIEVDQTVAVHVRRRHARAVIIVDGLLGPARVIRHVVDERDAAFGLPVVEVEIMERLHGRGRRRLGGRGLGEQGTDLPVVLDRIDILGGGGQAGR